MHLTAQVLCVELYITALSDYPCFIFQHHTNAAVETKWACSTCVGCFLCSHCYTAETVFDTTQTHTFSLADPIFHHCPN